MSQLVQPALVADKMLEFMDNLIQIGKTVNRQYENVMLERKGQTFSVKKPPRYESQDGPVISSLQSVNQGKIDVTANYWKTIPVELSGIDLTMNESAFDDWAENYLKPAASRIVNDVELSLYGLYKDVYNFAGTPGTGPTSYSVISDAREVLSNTATPQEDRHLALSPKGHNKLANGLSSGFNPQRETGAIVMKGQLPMVAGFDPFEAQNTPVHTVGAHGGTPVTNGSGQVGDSLITDGWTTATTVLKQGDVFTVADVYAVNPNNGQSTGNLQTFVATADGTSDASGNLTISISPSIITSGAHKTVNAAAGDGKTITVKGTASTAYGQNIGYHKNAFGLVMCSVRPPRGLKATVRNYKGMAISITTGPDIMNFSEIWRADAAWAVKTFWAENAIRITN